MKTDRSDSCPGIADSAKICLVATALAWRDQTMAYPRSSAQLSAFIRGNSYPPMTPMKS
jgi:hypothetical protein